MYPPLTIGLSSLLAITEGIYVFSKDKNPKLAESYFKLTRFFAKLFAINFAVGVATGIVMEFEFGTNWSRYSSFVGDIFGAPLAIEGLFAFFMESIFVGVMLLGWNRLSPKAHWISTVLVALGSTNSALWILIANSWMQTPSGYKIGPDGKPIMTNFWDVVFNPSASYRILHTVTAAWEYAAFFMAGISAWFLLKNSKDGVAKLGLKFGITAGLIISVFQIFVGDLHAKEVADYQPTKLAMMEALWKTQKDAPELLFAIPDQAKQTNLVEIGIPHLLSIFADHSWNGKVLGLKDAAAKVSNEYHLNPPLSIKEFPPVALEFWVFHLMVYLGFYFALITLIGYFLVKSGKAYTNKTFLKIMFYSTFAPLVACELGWFTAEIGRQPFTAYGLLRTAESTSPNLSAPEIAFSLFMFITIYTALGAVAVYLLKKELNERLHEELNHQEKAISGKEVLA